MARMKSVAPNGIEVAVCVADPSLREHACAALVSGGHTIFAREATVDALLSSANGSVPASVVVSSRRPDRAAMGDVRAIRSGLEDAHIVLLCERASGGDVRRALELGIDGLVLSDTVGDVLAAVVTTVCAGQVSVPRGQRAEVRAHVLTTREKQILGLVVMGLTNGEIAHKLYLAESTVKSHLSSAFSKLGVASRNEAVNVILDPERGQGLGILTIPAERIQSRA